MAWRLLAVLLVLTAIAWSAPIVIKCYDGSSSAIVRWPNRSTTRLSVCDLDHALDGRCQFRVSLGATGRKRPHVFEMTLQAGRRKRVLPACERGGRPALVLECRAYPSGVACPTTTTTTLPVGLCVTDADCAIFPPECQHCELGDCEGFPTINPNGSISNVVCPIPR